MYIMKNREISSTKSSTGTGYLAGGAIGLIAGIVIFILTRNIAVAIPPAVALGIPMGISMDQKLTGRSAAFYASKVRLILATISIGIVFFISLALLVKLF